jgi:hypothetical protein
MASAGCRGESGDMKSACTLGQPAPIGIGSAGGMSVHSGFWGRYWIPTPVDDTPVVYRTVLKQNYPNPFNPTTTIAFSLAGEGTVEIMIFNVAGQKVRTLIDERRPAGRHTVTWDGRNDGGRRVATGVYFYRMRTDGYSAVRKMLILR